MGRYHNCTLVQLVFLDGHVLPRAERIQFFVCRTSAITEEAAAWLRALDGRCVDRGREMGYPRLAKFDALHEWLHALAEGGRAVHVAGSALGDGALRGAALTRVVTIGMLAEGEADASPAEDEDEDEDEMMKSEGELVDAMAGLNVDGSSAGVLVEVDGP